MSSVRNHRSGITSLITVLIVSIILSIMVIGFVRIAIREQRQSTDSDLSARALYSAEAGLEDAISYLKNTPIPVAKTVCNPPVVLSAASEMDMAYTCQLIDLEATNYQTDLPKDRTVNIPLKANGAFDRIVIDWHENSVASDGLNPPARSTNTLLTESAWTTAGHPAMLKAYLYSYPNSGNFGRGSFGAIMAYLNPTTSALTPINLASYTDGSIIYANCSTNRSPFYCQQTIIGLVSTRNYVLRLTSLYRGTSVQVKLENSATNATVPIVGVQAIVDVTGRAGDVYRRVESRVDFGSSFADYLPDHAIISATDICKDAEIPIGASTTGYVPNDCL